MSDTQATPPSKEELLGTVDPVRATAAPVGTTDVAAELPAALQRRNIVYFVIITCLMYLCAPVLYVDFVQTTLCDKLGASKAVANLPSSAARLMTGVPLIVAWLVPHTRWVRPMVAGGSTLLAVIGASMAMLLVTVKNPTVLIAGTVTYGGLCGFALGVQAIYMWEVLARGVAEAKRGVTFSLCYGIGPVLAVGGSVGAHFILQDRIAWLSYPRDYALLFALIVPAMMISAILATRFHLSHAQEVVRRESFVTFVIGGAWDFLRDRRFLIVTVSYVLMFSAWWVMNNAMLQIEEVLGVEPKKMAGLCDALRFGGKVICGLALGWIYARFAGRTATISTAVLTAIAIGWALAVPGRLYLGTFALFGGGELAGVYYFTYIISASSPDLVKRNTALLGMAGALVSIAPFALGTVADHYGIPVSLWVAFGVALVAVTMLFALPAHPEAQRLKTED